MNKNKKHLAVLSSTAMGLLIASALTTTAQAKVVSYVEKDGTNNVSFSLDDLLKDYQNNLAGQASPMFDAYIKNVTNLVAFQDDQKGFVSAQYVEDAYATALQTGAAFNIDTVAAAATTADIKADMTATAWTPTPVTTGLSVSSVSAVNGTTESALATGVKATSKIKVYFSNSVDATTVTSSNVYLTQNGVKQLAAITYDATTKAATLAPAVSLTQGGQYTLTVQNVKDASASANTVTAYSSNFTVSNNIVVVSGQYNKVAGNLTGTCDTDINGGNVNDATEPVQFIFNASLDVNTVNTTNIKLYDITDAKYIAITSATPSTTTSTNDTVTVTPTGLTATHQYKLVLGKNIADLAGNTLGDDYTSTFYYNGSAPTYGTITVGDKTSSYTNIYPGLTSGSGKPGFKIQVQAMQDLDSTTVNTTNVYLAEKVTGNSVPAAVTYESGSRYIIVTPSADLKELADYTLTIKNVKGTNGLSLPDKKDTSAIAFTTGDFTRPTVVSSTPAAADASVAVTAPIVVNFSEKMSDTSLSLGTNVTLVDVSNNNTAFANFTNWTKSLSGDGKTLTLTPISGSELLPNHSYKLTLKKDVVADVSANANALAADYTVLFTTANTATDSVKDVKLGGFADTNTTLNDGDLNVTSSNLDVRFTSALKANDSSYKVENQVKVERYVAETGVWKTLTNAATAGSDAVGVAIDSSDTSNKSLKITPATAWTDDADTAIDESAGAYNGTWVKDTQYRVTVPVTVQDSNGNGVQPKVFTFTVGTKPSVQTTANYPNAFQTNVPVNTAYYPVVISDAESKLQDSTLNPTNITITNKATGAAAPVSFAYKNAAADVTLSNIKSKSSNTFAFVTEADAAKVQVGSILQISTDKYYVVTGKSTSAGTTTITVDRSINAANGSAVVVKQGVVFKLNDGASLDGDTEYLVKATGVKDIAGNTADTTSYTFRSAKVATKLAVATTTIADGATGVAVTTPIKITFNGNVDTASLGTLSNGEGTLKAGSANPDSTNVVALYDVTNSAAVPGTYKLDTDGKTLIVTPQGLLKANTQYKLQVLNTVSSDNSDPTKELDATNNYALGFMTEQTASVKPTIVSAKAYEVNGKTGIQGGDKIIVQLNTGLKNNLPVGQVAVSPGSAITATTLAATSTSGLAVGDVVSIIDNTTVKGYATISALTSTLITFSSVTDTSGNAVSDIKTIVTTTGAGPYTTTNGVGVVKLPVYSAFDLSGVATFGNLKTSDLGSAVYNASDDTVVITLGDNSGIVFPGTTTIKIDDPELVDANGNAFTGTVTITAAN